ncbi:hypothetical protein GJ688_02020 [Heliobacillus mobilis]|uniref:HK97 gp10 family phage protein n=1 Tax=Heliobacterium mobile TaxID=28064 RepID=A0A6I3SCK2_HELMO|nr:HK97 gp10 family phage protein [Heliobacterium mobile]MTV47759.1 hypothetical protein [Heliobacterium mobile]
MADIKRVAMEALHIAAEGVLTKAQDKANYKTGTLRRSGTVTDHPRRNTVSISFNTPYAPSVHDGSKPHDIVADKKTLAVPVKNWRGPVNEYGAKKLPKLSRDGQFVLLGKRVRHPGYKGNPFLKDAMDESQDKVTNFLASRIGDAMIGGK